MSRTTSAPGRSTSGWVAFWSVGLSVFVVGLSPGAAAGPDEVDRVNEALQAAAGPAVAPLDTSGVRCMSVRANPPAVTVLLSLPPEIRDNFNDSMNDHLVRLVIHALACRPELQDFDVRAIDADGNAVALSALIPPARADTLDRNVESPLPDAGISPAAAVSSGQPPIFGQGRPAGPLTGKTVYLSPGHGWYYHSDYGWLTQRGNNYGIVEDFSNSELACQYLVQYLENAGADVWTCRDRCLSTVEVIVDNAGGQYSETGTWYNTSGWNGGGRYAIASTTENATATFTPSIPAGGYYPLYLYYVKGTDRVPDALVKINHTGGTTEVRVNQQLTRSNWRYVATFYWFAGTGQTVTISNQSDYPGNLVIADAIRIGGGVGNQPPNPPYEGQPPSGKRRSDECSVYWAKYQGASSAVYDSTGYGDGTDDVTCRPRYAEWEDEAGEDAVYLSVHSNAYSGALTGTETYMYLDGTPAGSSTLRNLVHTEVVSDLRAEWDPDWVDRGEKTADFGEVRLLDNIPGALIETAFHDNPGDASHLREPNWRRIVARALYQGIAKYFGGTQVALLPEPPTHACARSNGSPNSVEVAWRPPPSGGAAGGPASKYKVYRSTNGYAFDNGTETTSTSLLVGDLPPDTLYYFRVSALNDGGESFPTPVLACKTPASAGPVPVLIVDGYDALDQSMNIPVYESGSLGTAQRQFLDRRMNSYDYVIEHAGAITAGALAPAFDGAVNEAIEDGDVSLHDYVMVDWFVGRESVDTETFSAVEQSAITSYLAGRGGLFVSGMQIAWDLGPSGNTADLSFLNNTLRAAYVAYDAGVYTAAGAAGSIFDGIAALGFDDGTHGTYDVSAPNTIAANAGSGAAMTYGGGATAGIQSASVCGESRVVFISFPFETIYDAGQRHTVMDRVVQFLVTGSGGPATVYGDFDSDGDVDQEDYAYLQACLTGAAVPVNDPACCEARYDSDPDVDGAELVAFKNCISGANVPANPACDD